MKENEINSVSLVKILSILHLTSPLPQKLVPGLNWLTGSDIFGFIYNLTNQES